MHAEIDMMTAKTVGIKFKSASTNSQPPITIELGNSQFDIAGTKSPLRFKNEDKKVSLRIFVDRSVMEVFINDEACATRVIPLLDADAKWEAFATGGQANFKRVEFWPIKTIW